MADDLFGVFDEEANNDNESVALGAYTLNDKIKETNQNSSYEIKKSENNSKRKLDQITDNDQQNQNNICQDTEIIASDENEINPSKRFQQEEFDDWRYIQYL
jgi:hypothetical protein